MTDQLIKHPRFKQVSDKQVYDVLGKQTYDTGKSKSLLFLCDNLANENGKLRMDKTKLRITLNMIIEDLQKEAEKKEPIIIRKEYVEWIKKEIEDVME